MYYLKIDQNEIIEAPHIIERNGKKIYGYNKESNEKMLLADGYKKFTFPAFCYIIRDGEIVENETDPVQTKTIFTKLEIRRAMRQLGMEDTLNQILSGNSQFQNDWNDAQEIDLNDPIIQNAINSGLISQEIINSIKEIL